MIYRTLGGTGEKVSAIGVGGWHLGLKHVDEQLAIRIVRSAIDRGINFLDNSWDYSEGVSELRMGEALRDGYRQHAFVMTKIDGRSRKEAARQLDESLRRLRVDYIDLVQHHEIIRFEDPHRIFDDQGANAALVEARTAGKIRYIGFTGHKDPRIHLHMLDALLARTREAAATGRFEPFKTSSIFDGTAENPQWLGEEPAELRGLMPA